MLTNRASTRVAIGAVLSALACGAAQAGLNIDIRATSVNGVPITGAGGQTSKFIPSVNVGDVIAFDIFAVVTGTNVSTADDKFLTVSGSWLSSGSIKGTIVTDLVRANPDTGAPGFDAPGSSVGLQQDLDGDGDLDVGSNNPSSDLDYWSARSTSGDAQSAASPIGRRIGFGAFTVMQSSGFDTLINFRGRNSPLAANYVQDGVTVSEASIDGLIGLRMGFEPEPATAALFGLAGLARLAARGRRL